MEKAKQILVEKKYLLTFILITSLFALWGFANDITNPMVAAFQTVMELSATKASLVQFAFYGGYATMALPAALFVRKYSYKKGILLGLALSAIGAFLFIPAAEYQEFSFFCISLYVLTFGLAFLETTSNPYILSLGTPETATRRLNLAQSFNPIGSLCGMFVVIALFVKSGNGTKVEKAEEPKVKDSLRRLWNNKCYRYGVLTQVFYVATQIMCWTFIIQYADNLGINKSTAQWYNILAMGLFLSGRFVSTMLMKYVNGRMLLMVFAICAMCTTAGAILIVGNVGLYCLVATSAFMSLMFPTIYGVALEDVGQDSTLGAAFLVMAIVGGALMPPLQGMIIDNWNFDFLPSVNASFILPFICFCVVATYGYVTERIIKNRA